MAVDKLVDSTQLNADLTSVANAIRTKGGTSAQLAFPADFVTAIGNISGGSTLIEKTVSANGVYNASSDSADGYSKVTVSVPASAVDTGTKSISTNGTHDVIGYASANVSVPASAVDTGTKSITANGNNQDVVGYAAVDVAVPNTYAAGDEGKVVSGGALVAQTSDTVTANDTYDTTLINSLTVNVSGGASYDGVEYVTDANGIITEVHSHMSVIPPNAFDTLFFRWANNTTRPVFKFSTKPTKVGSTAFRDAKMSIDGSGLTDVVNIGDGYALSPNYSQYSDGSSFIMDLQNYVGYTSSYTGQELFRGGSVYAPKKYNLPKCTYIPQFAWYGLTVQNFDIAIGSVGYAVTNSKNQPFGGTSSASGTVVIYTNGASLDTVKNAVQNGIGSNITVTYKAAENTTYGGNSYSAGDTILTV